MTTAEVSGHGGVITTIAARATGHTWAKDNTLLRSTDAPSPGRGAAAEDRRGVESARAHRVRGPVGVRALFVGSRCSRLRGPGQLRGRECIPRCARTASPAAGLPVSPGVGMVGASGMTGHLDERDRAHEPRRLFRCRRRTASRFRCCAAAGALVRRAGTCSTSPPSGPIQRLGACHQSSVV